MMSRRATDLGRWFGIVGFLGLLLAGCGQPNVSSTNEWKLEVRGGSVNVDDSIPTASRVEADALQARVNGLLSQYVGNSIGLQAARVRDVNVFVMTLKNGAKAELERSFEIVGPTQQSQQVKLAADQVWGIYRIGSQGEGEYKIRTTIEGQTLTSSFNLKLDKNLPVPQLTRGDYLPENAGLSASWQAVPGAQSYIMGAYDADGTLIRSTQGTALQAELRFPVAPQTRYTVTVLALSWNNALDRKALFENLPERFDASAREITFVTPPTPVARLNELSTSSLNYIGVTGKTSTLALNFRNIGAANLNYSASLAGSGATSFNLPQSSGSVAPLAYGALQVRATCTGTESATANLNLVTNDPQNTSLTIPLTLECLPARQAQLVLRRTGHSQGVNGAVWLGDQVASLSYSNRLVVWDASTARAKRVISLTNTGGSYYAMPALSPDGTRLALSLSQAVRVWDIATGQENTSLVGLSDYQQVAWSPDGTRIAAVASQQLALYNSTTGAQISRWDIGITPTQVAWSADGSQISVYSRNQGDGFRRYRVSDGALLGSLIPINPLTMNQNGTQVLTIYNESTSPTIINRYRILNTSDGSIARTFGGPNIRLHDSAWSLDGSLIAIRTLEPDRIEVWRTSDGTLQRTVEYDDFGRVLGMPIFSPDNSQLLLPLETGLLRAVNLSTGANSQTFGYHTSSINGLAFDSSNTRILSSSGFGSLLNWTNLSTGEVRRLVNTANGSLLQIAWINNNSQIAGIYRSTPSGPGGATELLRVYNAQTGEQLRSVTLRTDLYFTGEKGDYSWSPDGARLAFTDNSRNLSVYQVSSGNRLFEATDSYNGNPLTPLAWKPDGNEILRITSRWNAQTGARLPNLEPSPLGSCATGFGGYITPPTAWSPDRQKFLCFGTNSLNIFDAATQQQLYSLNLLAQGVLWSHDNKMVLVVSGRTLQLRTLSGEVVVQVTGSQTQPSYSAMTLSPDGQYIAVGDLSGTLEVYRLSSQP